MSAKAKRSRKRRAGKQHTAAPVKPKYRKSSWLLGGGLAIAICGVIGFSILHANKGSESNSIPIEASPASQDRLAVEPPSYQRKVQALDELLAMTAEQLAEVGIAEMNMLCATDLPGAGELDIDGCLARLDEWAAKVKLETERHLYRVSDPRYAEYYRNSESYFRASMLLQVLQEDCGAKYSSERMRDVDFTNSKDLFLHGMIDDDNGGTCVSMPVLYVAVGRRLGYPLKLVTAKAHLFCRWDDGEERFNIEGSGAGMSSYEDEHYMTWPGRITKADVAAGRYLAPLSPSEELAVFLASRGHCLIDNGRVSEAVEAYAYALQLNPDDPDYAAWLNDARKRASRTSARRNGAAVAGRP